MIILDFGSGNTCRNDRATVEQMIEQLHEVDTKKQQVVIKWQLFESAPPNVPLNRDVFDYAYRYAKRLGYASTASVFDGGSLSYLSEYAVPFIKIACRPELYYMASEINTPFYVSVPSPKESPYAAVRLACVSKYPAKLSEYEDVFSPEDLDHVSDHTVGWKLYEKYNPSIIEKHYVHEREEGNPDSGKFAVTPRGLVGIL